MCDVKYIANLEGKIEAGVELGKSLGYPTMNLSITQQAGGVEQGVYIISSAVLGEKFDGVMHFGTKSRGLKNDQEKGKIFCEIHLFDFDKNAYGEKVSVQVLKKIRNVREFNSDLELKEQIGHDIETAKHHFQYESNKKA